MGVRGSFAQKQPPIHPVAHIGHETSLNVRQHLRSTGHRPTGEMSGLGPPSRVPRPERESRVSGHATLPPEKHIPSLRFSTRADSRHGTSAEGVSRQRGGAAQAGDGAGLSGHGADRGPVPRGYCCSSLMPRVTGEFDSGTRRQRRARVHVPGLGQRVDVRVVDSLVTAQQRQGPPDRPSRSCVSAFVPQGRLRRKAADAAATARGSLTCPLGALRRTSD